MKIRNVTFLAAIILFGVSILGFAANDEKPSGVDISADELSYNTKTNMATAKGNVVITKDDMRLSGEQAKYNTTTQTGEIMGQVLATRDTSQLTCDKIDIIANNLMIATGTVKATSSGYRYVGPRLEYDLTKQRVYSPLKATVFGEDGKLTAGKIEFFPSLDKAYAYDGIRIDSPTRGIVATSDKAEYIGGQSAIVKMLGNARATRAGDTLQGDALTYNVTEDIFTVDGNAKVTYQVNAANQSPKSSK